MVVTLPRRSCGPAPRRWPRRAGALIVLLGLGACVETRSSGADGRIRVARPDGGVDIVNMRCGAVEPVQVTYRVDGSSVSVPTAAGAVSVNLGGVQLSRQAAEQVGAPFYLIQALINDLCTSRLLRPNDPSIDVQRRELIGVMNNYIATLGRARSSEEASVAASQATQAVRQVVPGAAAEAPVPPSAVVTGPAPAAASVPAAAVTETRLLTLRSGRAERMEIGQREAGETVELCVPDQVPGLPQGGRIEARLASATQPASQAVPLAATERRCTVLGEAGRLFVARIDGSGPTAILVTLRISNGAIGWFDTVLTAATGAELRVPLSFSVVRPGPRAP